MRIIRNIFIFSTFMIYLFGLALALAQTYGYSVDMADEKQIDNELHRSSDKEIGKYMTFHNSHDLSSLSENKLRYKINNGYFYSCDEIKSICKSKKNKLFEGCSTYCGY